MSNFNNLNEIGNIVDENLKNKRIELETLMFLNKAGLHDE